jgi:quinol monooxygenase YgiN
MIHVIAEIQLNPETKENFLAVLHRNIPSVTAENGCLAYEPAMDLESGLPVQGELRKNTITIIEAWESLAALHAHLKTPHMAAYREATRDLVKKVVIRVLEPT